MDDGDLDFSNPDTYLCPALGTDPPSSCSMDSYFDEILKDTEHLACTHTHTCNPPVHDLSHTHTCVHVHTKIVAASPGDAESPSENNSNGNAASKKRPSGNRAAVRNAAAQVANSCDFRCNHQMYCNPGMQGAISGQVLGQGACDVASMQCIGSTKSGSTKLPVCGGLDTLPAVCLPNVEKK
ncbi:Basic leucine zipper 19 [Zea mays]|uniref:Basic leucine zipper 19 n=1 Tax=Zea mays TaxID=4577 RepID=A0A1D6LMW8_MAIZE|nr:Basic leucine zipper 19 [Zea mays]